MYLDGPGGVYVAVSGDLSVIGNQWHPQPPCSGPPVCRCRPWVSYAVWSKGSGSHRTGPIRQPGSTSPTLSRPTAR